MSVLHPFPSSTFHKVSARAHEEVTTHPWSVHRCLLKVRSSTGSCSQNAESDVVVLITKRLCTVVVSIPEVRINENYHNAPGRSHLKLESYFSPSFQG